MIMTGASLISDGEVLIMTGASSISDGEVLIMTVASLISDGEVLIMTVASLISDGAVLIMTVASLIIDDEVMIITAALRETQAEITTNNRDSLEIEADCPDMNAAALGGGSWRDRGEGHPFIASLACPNTCLALSAIVDVVEQGRPSPRRKRTGVEGKRPSTHPHPPEDRSKATVPN
jgi:hypothetical protein